MYVQKAFEDQFGNQAEALIPIVVEGVTADTMTGEIGCNFHFLGYSNLAAYGGGKRQVDTFRTTSPITISQEELMVAEGDNLVAKFIRAFTDKALSVEEGEPLYRFTGNIGELDMAGAVIVP